MGWGIHILYWFAPFSNHKLSQVLESRKTVKERLCLSSQKAKNLWRLWDTYPACEKLGKQVTNTGKNFEHDTTFDKYVKKNLFMELSWKMIFYTWLAKRHFSTQFWVWRKKVHTPILRIKRILVPGKNCIMQNSQLWD